MDGTENTVSMVSLLLCVCSPGIPLLSCIYLLPWEGVYRAIA
jgi:hypothetical protein